MTLALDQQRRRWESARRKLGMRNIDEPDFARQGLPVPAESLSARILLLPSDPLAHLFDIDERFAEAWSLGFSDPRMNRTRLPDNVDSAFTDGFVTYSPQGDVCTWYCSIDHAGALEVGLGAGAARGIGTDRIFHLSSLVGWTWWLCEVHSTLATALAIPGPFELSVSLVDVAGAQLGGLGSDWIDPRQKCPRRSKAGQTNILLRREGSDFSGEVARDAAFSIGRQIENAFGANANRFRPAYTRTLIEFAAATKCFSV